MGCTHPGGPAGCAVDAVRLRGLLKDLRSEFFNLYMSGAAHIFTLSPHYITWWLRLTSIMFSVYTALRREILAFRVKLGKINI